MGRLQQGAVDPRGSGRRKKIYSAETDILKGLRLNERVSVHRSVVPPSEYQHRTAWIPKYDLGVIVYSQSL